MPSYNLMKREGREKLREDRRAELEAIQANSWPRNISDIVRWNCPPNKVPKEWAAHMCQWEIAYLDRLEVRLAEGDPDLRGWEGWVSLSIN